MTQTLCRVPVVFEASKRTFPGVQTTVLLDSVGRSS